MSVAELHDVTTQLVALLSNDIDKEKREDMLVELDQFLEKRQKLIQEISPPYTESELQLGKEIVEFNLFIDQKLQSIKQEIQKDMNKLQKTKATSTKYTNPYNIAADGMFFDKRK